MSSMSSQRVMALAGGLALALGLVMSGAALAALFTLSDSRAVGTVVQIERDAQGSVTGSVIRFADGDHREYTFSSAHTPSRLRDTVEVQFNARDPEGTARTSVDRLVWDPEGTVRTSVDRLVWAYTAAIGLTAAVLGGALLFFAGRLQRVNRDGSVPLRDIRGSQAAHAGSRGTAHLDPPITLT